MKKCTGLVVASMLAVSFVAAPVTVNPRMGKLLYYLMWTTRKSISILQGRQTGCRLLESGNLGGCENGDGRTVSRDSDSSWTPLDVPLDFLESVEDTQTTLYQGVSRDSHGVKNQ